MLDFRKISQKNYDDDDDYEQPVCGMFVSVIKCLQLREFIDNKCYKFLEVPKAKCEVVLKRVVLSIM